MAATAAAAATDRVRMDDLVAAGAEAATEVAGEVTGADPEAMAWMTSMRCTLRYEIFNYLMCCGLHVRARVFLLYSFIRLFGACSCAFDSSFDHFGLILFEQMFGGGGYDSGYSGYGTYLYALASSCHSPALSA